VHDDLTPIRQAIDDFKPQIAFNLLEAFNDIVVFDQNVVSYLELLHMPYTGCNPRGLTLARDKSLARKLLSYHRIPSPAFTVVPLRRKVSLPRRLTFPLIVKSLTYEASTGISQASVVTNEEQLARRVQFIHESVFTPAIVEEYIEGREFYVGVIGNERLRVFPVWEMYFDQMRGDNWPIATERVKWNSAYQDRHQIMTGEAEIEPEVAARIQHVAKRVYRALELSGYARIDFRMRADGVPHVIEANPNPQLAEGEDFARGAAAAGMSYPALLERIMALGLRWQPTRDALGTT
jgi:D-alanine-D-alanine ligase